MTMPEGWKSDQFPSTNLGPEQIIWKNDVMTGIINRKVAETQIITNYKVIQNKNSVSLADLDDVIVMNSRRESQSQRGGYYARGFVTSYGTSRGKTIGDVVFMYRGQPAIIFRQIADPTGVCRLAKTARRRFVTALKQAEKAEAKLIKERERNANVAKTQAKQNRSGKQTATVSVNADSNYTSQTACNKCGNLNPDNSNFCVKCGSQISPGCSKCGRSNSPGSAFCNNCGFALP